jgi:hypothetical protein
MRLSVCLIGWGSVLGRAGWQRARGLVLKQTRAEVPPPASAPPEAVAGSGPLLPPPLGILPSSSSTSSLSNMSTTTDTAGSLSDSQAGAEVPAVPVAASAGASVGQGGGAGVAVRTRAGGEVGRLLLESDGARATLLALIASARTAAAAATAGDPASPDAERLGLWVRSFCHLTCTQTGALLTPVPCACLRVCVCMCVCVWGGGGSGAWGWPLRAIAGLRMHLAWPLRLRLRRVQLLCRVEARVS